MKRILLLAFISFFLLSSIACGFEDTVQRYDTDYTEVWDQSDSSEFYQNFGNGPGWSYSDFTIENRPVDYPTSKAMKFYVDAQGRYEQYSGTATTTIISKETLNVDYLGLTVYDASVQLGTLKIYYYNESMVLLSTTDLGLSTKGLGSPDRYELIRVSSNIELYKNGVFVSTSSLLNNELAFVKIQAYAYGSEIGSTRHYLTAYIDDISTSSVVGINEEWTEAATYIDTSHGIRSMSSYPESLFEMKLYKISDNSLINSTTLINQSGFVRWNRSEIFGTNYGMFKASIERDDVELANALFSHEYSQTGAYTPTIITVYSSTNATVQDEDSTGGSTNQNGYRYLSPHDNGDKIYPISISLNNSNSVDVIVSANPEYVNSSPLTISGLSDAKSYHVFIDGEFITQITGASSYYYNIQSFSTHTFSLIDSVNIPVIEIGSVGGSSSSGLITVDEITLTKDLFDVLTVEQIEDMDVSQEVKDQLIKLKSINLNQWKLALGIGFIWLIVEVGRGKNAGFGLVISIALIVFSAYKLGYF